MVGFVLSAAVLTLAGVLAVAVPLLRRAPAGSPPASWAALAAGALLAGGSALLYLTWSNWTWRPGAPPDSPENMVARLARELEHDPQNLEGWLMLGRSYTVLQEYPLAVRAFERADRLSGGRNAEALTGEAEALALNDESELDGRAARLIEQALVLAPDSGRALFFGAAIAERRGDLPLARQRLVRLLALNPPASVRSLFERQISAIDQKLAAGAAGGSTPAGAAPAAGTAAASVPPRPGGTAGPVHSPVVRVNVTLAPTLAAASAGAPLFVFVRDPNRAGPPLAVKRLDSRFPQRVALTPADSMVPGRAFSAGQSVEVVARIARSGSPVGATGDPFGEVTYRVGHDGLVSLVIDRLTP
jgi:cytochrome c-type biogenesis protein CcmH